MKIFCLIATPDGRVHAAATRSPDLLRRELATRFGGAELFYCAVPPHGQSATNQCARLDAAIDFCRTGPGTYELPRDMVMRCVHRLEREDRRAAREAIRRGRMRRPGSGYPPYIP